MSETKPRYGYRAAPQLSANQIAEYLGATAPRRTSIIRDARFPKTSVVARYEKAREGLVNFLGDGTRSIRHLAEAAEYLERRKNRLLASEWIIQDSQFSLEAIDIFQRSYNKLGLHKINCRLPQGRLPHLLFGGTRVSVALDVITIRSGRDTTDNIGGAVLIFSRGEKSTNARVDRCKTIAGLIYIYCQRHLTTLGTVDPKLCLAVDIFAPETYACPGTFAKKMLQIENAGEEIAARWSTIAPPIDYDGPEPD